MTAPRGGSTTGMAKNDDQQAKQAAIKEAKRQGESPSAAGVTTGASKQTEHKRDKDREPKGDRKT